MTGARELGLGRFPPLGHVPTSERKFAICNDDNTASLTLGARFNFHAERREPDEAETQWLENTLLPFQLGQRTAFLAPGPAWLMTKSAPVII